MTKGGLEDGDDESVRSCSREKEEIDQDGVGMIYERAL